MNRYTRKTPKLIETILSEGQKLSKRKASPLQENYIRQLYLQTPLDFLKKVDARVLFIAAMQHFAFANSRKPQEDWRIKIYNPAIQEDGWESERTVIDLNMPDRPFILDSITAEILRQGYTIYEVIHPVVRLERDKNGLISHIYDADELDKPAESCMHIQISHIGSKKDRKALQAGLEKVLTYVKKAVEDWQTMLDRASDVLEELERAHAMHSNEEVNEAFDFIRWAVENNYIFLGYRQYEFVHEGKHPKLVVDKEHEYGIFKAKEDEDKPVGLQAVPEEALKTGKTIPLIEITKSNRRSVVHRSVQMDYISIKRFDTKGKLIGEHRFIGLFTSSVYHQSATRIPIIRKKIDAVIRRSDFAPQSHNSKALMAILQSYPRDELLQISTDELLEKSMGIVELAERPATKLFVRRDRYERFVSCIVYIPRDRFNTNMREKVQHILEEAYGGQMSDFYSQLTESPLARLHLLIRVEEGKVKSPDLKTLERKLVDVTNNWFNGLRNRLITEMGERKGEKFYRYYVNAFTDSYKQSYHFGGTYHDIVKMEEAYAEDRLTIELYKLEEDDEFTYQVKIFQPRQLVMLSEVMPVLENMGFDAIDQHTYQVKPEHQDDSNWIMHFRLKVSRGMKIPLAKGARSPIEDIKAEFEEAMYKVWHGELENDALNKLILRAKMTWRNVEILRAYLKYTAQTAFPYSSDFMASVVARHPLIATQLMELFHARFNPETEKRQQQIEKANDTITVLLSDVSDVVDDRVIRQFRDTIQHTLRTNAFQTKKGGGYKDYISLKLDATQVPNLPLPRPYREIFVYSVEVEGIHLRGGKVARGGLRWSDRREDFRTEILGLVKAQMVKNAVIVPVGSKGGFVVKQPVIGSRDAVIAQGIECYKNFLRGLLDITDNLVSGKVTHPKDVVIHDGEDPYLVVAADKGTATFSDIANEISAEYNHWLGDAFASGGSAGYDHKKMGITARGAWVSVQRHFAEMGLDVQKEDFTVAGIGDMSGDVFGNGMLLSKHIRLIAAFNHMHIFLDPNPEAATSYKERKRLFAKQRSGWEDYNTDLISKGGGVYSRSEKVIELSKEIRDALDIKESKLSPDELIRAIMRSPVDLIWNGGIGTYVKSADESHAEVGDKANDSTRVNADELRCKVIGEGGNLGLTQNARIAYALHGGRINTDAIDNSAGVDCSDHEVNIKIAFYHAMEREALTLKKRNELLEAMTENVASLVLKDNQMQTLALTISEQEGASLLETEKRLMRELEEKGLLNRKVEFLPDDEQLQNRALMDKGLTRPELAVILSYSKIDIFNELMDSAMPDDDYYIRDVISYFPDAMQKPYLQDIEAHPLKRELVATAISNSIVNRMGNSFFMRMKEDLGKKGCDVARAYTVVRDAFNLRELWAEIESLGSTVPVEVQVELHLEIRELVNRCVSWFLRHYPDPLNVSELIDGYKENVEKLYGIFDNIMSDAVRDSVKAKEEDYIAHDVPAKLATRIALFEALASACDIIFVAKDSHLPIREVGRSYYILGSRLHLGYLRLQARKLITDSHWDNLAIQSMIETLYDQQMRLTAKVTQGKCEGNVCDIAIDSWLEANGKGLSSYDSFFADMMRQEEITASMLMVAIGRVDSLL